MGTGQSTAMNFLPLAVFLATAAAQDTYYCADGWDLYTTTWHGQEHHSCFWPLTQSLDRGQTAREGAPNYGVQYWLGARDHGHHDAHRPVDWVWEERNTTVQWFDWGEDDPNNWNGQNCMTYLLYENIFGFKDFKWNDWDCDVAADFICEKIIA